MNSLMSSSSSFACAWTASHVPLVSYQRALRSLTQVVVKAGFLFAVGAVLLVELLNAAAVHHSGVGQNGADDIVLGQLIVLGHLDAAQDVCDAGDAEPGELFDELVGELELFFEVLLAVLRVDRRSKRWESSSSMAMAMSVFFTLWIQGMCLSPMPSMRWPPKPLFRIVGHWSASPTPSFMPG